MLYKRTEKTDYNKTFLKKLSIKDCDGEPHLCENSFAEVADASIWDKQLTTAEIIDYSACRL